MTRWENSGEDEHMTLQEILREATENGASDIFLIAGLPVTYKIKGNQKRSENGIMKPADILPLIHEIYDTGHRQKTNLEAGLDDDFSFSIPDLGRFRVNVFRQRGTASAVIRVIKFGIPDPEQLGIPENVLSLADHKTGLVLVAGAAGSGKPPRYPLLPRYCPSALRSHDCTAAAPPSGYGK